MLKVTIIAVLLRLILGSYQGLLKRKKRKLLLLMLLEKVKVKSKKMIIYQV